MRCSDCIDHDCVNPRVIERDGVLLHTAGWMEGSPSTECNEWTVIDEDEVDSYKLGGWEIHRERGRIYAICPCDKPVVEEQ